MTIFLSMLAAGVYVILLLAMAMRPHGSQLTRYELERRVKQGDAQAGMLLRRLRLIGSAEGTLLVMRFLAVILGLSLLSLVLGWWQAALWGVAGLVLLVPATRLRLLRTPAQRFYDHQELQLLTFLERHAWLASWLRVDHPSTTVHVGSREELAHVIDQAGAHLGADQQKLLLHSLKFDERIVADVMTRTGEIDTIDRRELLGPLVLDDLHKTGHSVFPVTDGGIDQVVGVLSIAGFLSLDSKRSITAEKSMTPHVERVNETASLRSALKVFLRTHQHLLIVTNDQGETVGVLSLHDIMTALFGRG